MNLPLLLVLLYLLASFLLGLAARRGRTAVGAAGSRRDYVLGGGSGALALFATMAATNFSAFTVFGLSGAGYRIGWSYYPLMGFGTGLMALSFFLLGMPLRRLSAERGWLSPADFIAARYGSPLLGKAFSLALICLTLPYLATQAIAGGRMLELATGMPYALGSLLVVGVTALYTLGGGFRAVAATDALQVAVLLGGAGLAFAAVVARAGGLVALGERLLAEAPGLLARAGAGGGQTATALLGAWLLWLLADPMFPQLFQRFYAARDDRSLARTAALYPLATGSVFFLTIGIGVGGAILAPGLVGPDTEQVFTTLALGEGRAALAAVFILAALAALMSTMDSQLLCLSSMIVQDFAPRRRGFPAGDGPRGAPRDASGDASGDDRGDRALVALLATLAWLASLAPPRLILDFLAGIAFPGYAVLAPLVIAGLYGRAGAGAAAAMLGTGILAVILEGAGWLRTAPLPQSVANLAFQLLALGAFRLFAPSAREEGSLAVLRLRDQARPAWLAAIALLALAGGGFAAYGAPGREPRLLLGLPTWVLGSALACVGLSLLFALWKRPAAKADASAAP